MSEKINPHPPRKWEDLEIGEERTSSPLGVRAEDMTAFAGRYDPQYFHNDAEAATDSLFGELVASGIYTAALWRIMDHQVNGDVDWVCGVEWSNVRWRKAVRAGDTLSAHSRVTSKRPSESRPNIGLAVLDHWVVNQDGDTVFSFSSTDLVYRRKP